MDQNDRSMGGSANTPPFGTPAGAVDTAADHQIPPATEPAHAASGSGRPAKTETERELERTRDTLAEAAAPVMAEKAQEAIAETADRVMHDPEVRSQVGRAATAAQHDAQRVAKEKIGKATGRAEEKLNQGMRQTADRIDKAAKRVDQMADERMSGEGMQGRAGEMAHSVADTMESIAAYLRDNDAQTLRHNLERQMEARPLQTLLVAVAAGWTVGKILR